MAGEADLAPQFTAGRCFFIDDLLPEALAHRHYGNFPNPSTMMPRKSLRERNRVTSQMDRHAPLREDLIHAFQGRRDRPLAGDFFHVTSFHGRPGEPVRALLLRGDATLRILVWRIAQSGLMRTRHYYDKKGE